jgi:hypothetical protein
MNLCEVIAFPSTASAAIFGTDGRMDSHGLINSIGWRRTSQSKYSSNIFCACLHVFKWNAWMELSNGHIFSCLRMCCTVPSLRSSIWWYFRPLGLAFIVKIIFLLPFVVMTFEMFECRIVWIHNNNHYIMYPSTVNQFIIKATVGNSYWNQYQLRSISFASAVSFSMDGTKSLHNQLWFGLTFRHTVNEKKYERIDTALSLSSSFPTYMALSFNSQEVS